MGGSAPRAQPRVRGVHGRRGRLRPPLIFDILLGRLAQQTAENTVDRQRVDGTTDLVALLREMGGMWQQAFPGRQLEIGAPAAAVARISSRAAQVVLYELLANAGEALVGSDTGRVSVQVEPSGDEWLVHVRDSGPGITYPQGREDLVFRAGRSTKEKGAETACTAPDASPKRSTATLFGLPLARPPRPEGGPFPTDPADRLSGSSIQPAEH